MGKFITISLAFVLLIFCINTSSKSVLTIFQECTQIKYIEEDFKKDEWQSPEKTQKIKKGDCEDISILLLSLLRQNGYDANVVFGLTHVKSKKFHAWVELKFKGNVYVMDPTVGFIAQRNGMPNQTYIQVLGIPKLLEKITEYEKRTGMKIRNP
jgi:hypothetical protein